jgi:hypothetical protein
MTPNKNEKKQLRDIDFIERSRSCYTYENELGVIRKLNHQGYTWYFVLYHDAFLSNYSVIKENPSLQTIIDFIKSWKIKEE